jgi:gluconolactonase
MDRRTFLQAASASVFAPALAQTPVETLGTGFQGAEGPVWMREGYLLFSDTRAAIIHKFTPGQGVTVFRENSGGANGNAIDKEGRLYTCEYRTRRVSRTGRNGAVEPLIEKFEGKRFNAPNDIVVRSDGHLWFTDPLFTPLDQRELDYYGVYHRSPDGSIECIAKPTGRPNGITLAPGGRTLYVANTDDRTITAYDVSKKGIATNERVLVSGLTGPPDGIKTDAKGNIYVTGPDVAIYSPQGQLVSRIATPEGTRNCAFGDPDFQSLYITGLKSLFRVRLGVKGAKW